MTERGKKSALDRPASTRVSGLGVISGAAQEKADIRARETFVVQVVSEGTETVLKLSGELDMAGARVLSTEIEAALESGVNRVILDISDVTFIDTAGTKTLLDSWRGAFGRLTVRGAQGLARGHWARLRNSR